MTRETEITCEDLLDKMSNYETFLKKQEMTIDLIASTNYAVKSAKPYNKSQGFVNKENRSNKQRVVCQFYGKLSHTAKKIWKITKKQPQKSTNYASASAKRDSSWLLDLGSTHHVTTDLSKMKLNTKYDGTESLIISDGSTLPITHIGSISLSAFNKNFNLDNTLCILKAKKKLIFVSQFCDSNSTSIELETKKSIIQSNALAMVGTMTNGMTWQKRLRQPFKNFRVLIRKISLPCHSLSSNKVCSACSYNKMHKISFFYSSLRATKPLQLVYTNV